MAKDDNEEVGPVVLSPINSRAKVKYFLIGISKFQLGSSNVFIRSMLNVLQLDISKWLKTHEF
jgi:hypothetical protein